MKAKRIAYHGREAFACFTPISQQHGIPWLSVAWFDADYMFARSFTANAVNEEEYCVAYQARCDGIDVPLPERIWQEWDYTEDEFRSALAKLHPSCLPYGMMDDRLRVGAVEAIKTLLVRVDPNDMHQRRYALVRMNNGEVLQVYAQAPGFGTNDPNIHGADIPEEWQRILEESDAAKEAERRKALEQALRKHGLI